MLHECAGPHRQKSPSPQEVNCPHCGAEVEMWTNEIKIRCASCSQEITRAQLRAHPPATRPPSAPR